VWLVRYVNRVIERRREIQQFETERTQKPENGSGKLAISVVLPDLTLWSPRRTDSWKTASARPSASALAVLARSDANTRADAGDLLAVLLRGSGPERFIVCAVPVDECRAPAAIKAGL